MNQNDFKSLEDWLNTLSKPETAEEIAAVAYSDAIDDIAIALSEFRVENKLTQKELADYLGFSQPMLSDYENGTRYMSLETACELLAKIGKGLSIRIDNAL